MPRKHGPGCRCCAPCNFGCDPCLGSVQIDTGGCGDATFMYPLPDPCTGLLTQIDPACSFSDCQLLPCDWTVTELCSYTDCEYSFSCTTGCTVPYVGSGHKFVSLRENVAYSLVAGTTNRISYSIQFIGNKEFKLTVTCVTYVTVKVQLSSLVRKTYETACISGACVDYAGESMTLTYDSGELVTTVADSDCGDYYETIYSPNTGAVLTCPSDAGSLDQVSCPDDASSSWYSTNITGEAIYEGTFTIADCDSFYGLFTLDRINASFGGDYNIGYRGGPGPISLGCTGCPEDCTDTVYTLVDCWPATIDVTIA